MTQHPQHVKDLLDSLQEQGARLKRTHKGWQIRFPNGGMAVMHLTTSDWRAERNFRSVCRQNQMTWPFDGRR